MHVARLDLAHAVRAASAIVRGEVITVERSVTAFHRRAAFHVRTHAVLVHAVPPAFRAVYEEGIPHVRGDLAVSPLVTGSGLETELEPGVLAIFLLAMETLDGYTVVRIESIDREAELVELARAR